MNNLDVDRQEGSCIAWSELWHQQWPRSCAARRIQWRGKRTGRLDSSRGQPTLNRIDIDRQEGSCVTWSKLQHRQWPSSGSTKTLVASVSCRIGGLRGLLDGLHDLPRDDFASVKRDKCKTKIAGQAPDRALTLSDMHSLHCSRDVGGSDTWFSAFDDGTFQITAI